MTATIIANNQDSGMFVQVATITPVVTASSVALAANPTSVTINEGLPTTVEI